MGSNDALFATPANFIPEEESQWVDEAGKPYTVTKTTKQKAYCRHKGREVAIDLATFSAEMIPLEEFLQLGFM